MTAVVSSCTCKNCKRGYEDSEKPCPFCGHTIRDISIKIVEELKIRDSIELIKFKKSRKKFLSKTKNGWFPSGDVTKYPDGVNLIQTVDRENKNYTKKVYDAKTGKVLKDLEEPLNQHKVK